MAKYFEVVTLCPVHKKNVYIIVEAANGLEAKRKVLGMVIECPWGPIDAKGHKFVVGFRADLKEIEDAYPLPEERLIELRVGTVSSAPTLTPITPVPPTPLEKFYYVDVDLAERQISKLEWWKR